MLQESEEDENAKENEEITREFQSGAYLKVGAGISSLTQKESDFILEQVDKYYGQGVLKDVEMTSRTAQFYNGTTDENDEYVHHDCTLYFIDEEQSVPYMTFDDLVEIDNEITTINKDYSEDSRMTITGSSDDDSVYTMSRADGSCVYVDLDDNLICLIDYDNYTISDISASAVDPVTLGGTSSSDILKHFANSYIKGDDLVIDLNAYGLHLINKDGVFYCPVTTYSDLFMAKLGTSLGYNTKDLFAIADPVDYTPDEDKSYGQIYFGVETPEKRSQDLINYTYCELCLAYDFHYGQKEEHGVTSFNEYFASTGLYKYLLSEDIEQYIIGLYKLSCVNLADGHSGVLGVSVYAPDISSDSILDSVMYGGNTSDDYNSIYDFYVKSSTESYYAGLARAEIYGDDVPMGYSEVGDTAFLTFDAFHIDTDMDYRTCELENDPGDTVMLVLYAHSQITRENSPIKNVVLNLANNGGGNEDAAAVVIPWFAGKNAPLSISNMTTGDADSVSYVFDVNRDGNITTEDILSNLGYNLYCVTSNISFSCGNLVPAALKSSGQVLILGRTSGGGACALQPLVTADGLSISVSGQLRINITKNGASTSVDQGIEPDVVIHNFKNLYDNDYISELIHSLQ